MSGPVALAQSESFGLEIEHGYGKSCCLEKHSSRARPTSDDCSASGEDTNSRRSAEDISDPKHSRKTTYRHGKKTHHIFLRCGISSEAATVWGGQLHILDVLVGCRARSEVVRKQQGDDCWCCVCSVPGVGSRADANTERNHALVVTTGGVRRPSRGLQDMTEPSSYSPLPFDWLVHHLVEKSSKLGAGKLSSTPGRLAMQAAHVRLN